MSKYRREFKCKICRFRRDATEQEELEMETRTRDNPFIWSEHCGQTMQLHNYRPTRYEFCDKHTCKYAMNRYCGCTCEGTFHGIGFGRPYEVKYLY